MNKIENAKDLMREASELSIRISQAIGTMDGVSMHIVAMVLKNYYDGVVALQGFNNEFFEELIEQMNTAAKVAENQAEIDEMIKIERLQRIRFENEKADS